MSEQNPEENGISAEEKDGACFLSRSAPDVQEKRKKWEAFKEKLCSSTSGELAFLDESGISINLVRRYGRAEGGERVTASVPLN